MKKTMLAMMLLAGGTLFAAPRVEVGIGFGAPARVAVARPLCPGPGYVWVDGFYDNYGYWVEGYWTLPAARFVGPAYVAPRYVGRDDFRFRDHDDHRFVARDRDDRRFEGHDRDDRRGFRR